MKKVREAFRILWAELSRISEEREKLGRIREPLMFVNDDCEDGGFSSLGIQRQFIKFYSTEELEMLDELSLRKSKVWKEFFSALLK